MQEEKTLRLHLDSYAGSGKHLQTEKRPYYNYPLHAHAYFELEIVAAGQGVQEINGKLFPMERGTACLLSPSAFHKVTAEGRDTLLWNISFDETAANVLFPSGEGYIWRRLPEEALSSVFSVCELLRQEKEEASASLLLSYLLRKICGGPFADDSSDPVQKAAEYVRLHFREKLTVGDGAAVACLSPVYFGALFAGKMGCSFNTYLNRCRVECARLLLSEGMGVADACFRAGFGSLSTFGTVFREQTGTSPKEYRRRFAEQGK